MKIKNIKTVLLLVAITVAFVGCSKDEYDSGSISEYKDVIVQNGIIRDVRFPDHCNDYIIEFEIEDWEFPILYKPNQLPKQFEIDNLKVVVKYRITEEYHSCGFGGFIKVINLIDIQKQ
jgi:hypothetical protein